MRNETELNTNMYFKNPGAGYKIQSIVSSASQALPYSSQKNEGEKDYKDEICKLSVVLVSPSDSSWLKALKGRTSVLISWGLMLQWFFHALFVSTNRYRTFNQTWRNGWSWAPCCVFSDGNHCLVYKKLEKTLTWSIDIDELAFSFETLAWKTLVFPLGFSGDFVKWDITMFFLLIKLVNREPLQNQCQWMSLLALLYQKEWMWQQSPCSSVCDVQTINKQSGQQEHGGGHDNSAVDAHGVCLGRS